MKNSIKISIIIPTLNEAKAIQKCIETIKLNAQDNNFEIIVIDGGSKDNTLEVLQSINVNYYQSKISSRAVQMNYGAQLAKGEVLYFLHADTLVPPNFDIAIINFSHISPMGSFKFKFDSHSLLLKINSFFTQFKFKWCRGGDQSIYITKEYFNQLGGYDETCVIMEEYPLIAKGIDSGNFVVIPKYVIGSSRKYQKNHYLKVQWANYRAFSMFKKGVNPTEIKSFYSNFLD